MMSTESGVYISALPSFAAFIAFMAPLVTVADEKRVDSDSAVKQGLHVISQELISDWGIVRETDTYIEMASKAKPADTIEGYCVRDVMRLRRDPTGQVAPLANQLEYANSSEERSIFLIFALAQAGEVCEKLAHTRFFRASSLGGLRPTNQMLEIVKSLAEGAWSRRATRYMMKYEDQVAQHCLNSNKPLAIRSARASRRARRFFI